jgi:hypothetical protein
MILMMTGDGEMKLRQRFYDLFGEFEGFWSSLDKRLGEV